MIVDHEDVVRRGSRALINNAPGLELVGECADGDEAVAIADELRPHVILFEINVTPDGFEDLIGKLRANEWCQVLVLTSRYDDQALYLSLRAHVSGFLSKDVTEAEIVTAIRQVAAGGAVLAPKITRRLIERFEITPPRDRRYYSRLLRSLSDRELDVLCALVSGKSNTVIAEELHVALTTVKTHVSNVLAKLGVHSRVEAALLAQEAGLG
jgi:DNA-binding NarL/FixJ family response regulator